MARPVNADPARTRERLLDAARARFSRRGAEATSLRDVARAAGVSLATIHYHFGSKDELYAACLDHARSRLSHALAPMAALLDRLGEQARRAASTTETEPELAAAIRDIVIAGFRFARADRSTVQLIMRPVLERGELDPRWRDRSLVPFLDRISGLLSDGLGRPAAELRLDLQSLVTLTMRYSLSTEAELARVVGLPPSAAGQAIAAVERHLVDLAQRMLLPRSA